jgi:hypothetical protein
MKLFMCVIKLLNHVYNDLIILSHAETKGISHELVPQDSFALPLKENYSLLLCGLIWQTTV